MTTFITYIHRDPSNKDNTYWGTTSCKFLVIQFWGEKVVAPLAKMRSMFLVLAALVASAYGKCHYDIHTISPQNNVPVCLGKLVRHW